MMILILALLILIANAAHLENHRVFNTSPAGIDCPKCVCDSFGTDFCCECSVPNCFPGDVTLTRKDGSEVPMKNLKAEDRIKTVSGGLVIYTEVKTFLKRRPSTNALYLTISTSTGNRLTLSDRHLVFVSSFNNTANMEPRFAASVTRGDYLFTPGQCGKGLCPSLVTHIEPEVKEGVYVPLTEHGTLVVNDIIASCYSSINHDIAHALTTPFRWFPWLLSPWQEDGYSPIIKWTKKFVHAILPRSLQYPESQAAVFPQKKTEF